MVVEEELIVSSKSDSKSEGISGSKICPVCKGFIHKGMEAYVDKLSFESKKYGFDRRCRYYDERCLKWKLREDLRKIYIKMMKNGKLSGSYSDIVKALDRYELEKLEEYMKERYVKVII